MQEVLAENKRQQKLTELKGSWREGTEGIKERNGEERENHNGSHFVPNQ